MLSISMIYIMANEKMITIPEAEYLQMQHQIKWLEHQIAEFKRMVFGSKSERFIAPDPSQLTLFDFPVQADEQEKTQEISYVRNKPEPKEKSHPFRTELPAHLPRKVVVIEPENLPANAKKIGVSIHESLEYEPPKLFVNQVIRPKFLIEQTDESTKIVIAPCLHFLFPRGMQVHQ